MSYFPGSPEQNLVTAPAAAAFSDAVAFPVVDSSGNFGRGTLAQMLVWIENHFADLSATTLPVLLTANTLLDASIHQRRLLIATTSLTITPPATLGNLGLTFDATVIADGTSVVTWGAGISTLAGTLTGGQSARIVAYNNGSGTVVRALLNPGAAAAAASPSVSIASVPTTGWVAGSALALTGATATLANITTAYAAFWSGTADVGSRQAFTSSATFAALSFTPAAANASSTIRVYDAATAGNLLAQTAVFTVAAAVAATATSYTTTPSATTGTAGTPVTLTYAIPSGTWPTSEVITPAVSGVTGVFNPVTVPVSGSTAGSTVFTPTSGATGTAVFTSTTAPTLTSTNASVSYTITAASALTQIAAPASGTAISVNGLYKLVTLIEGLAGTGSGISKTGNSNYGLQLLRANPTGVDRSYDGARDSGCTYNGVTYPTGSSGKDGFVDTTHGGITGLTVGFNPTPTGTATSAAYNTNTYGQYFTEAYRGKFPGDGPWGTSGGYPGSNYPTPPATGSTIYAVVTTSDGQTMYVGPMTYTA